MHKSYLPRHVEDFDEGEWHRDQTQHLGSICYLSEKLDYFTDAGKALLLCEMV